MPENENQIFLQKFKVLNELKEESKQNIKLMYVFKDRYYNKEKYNIFLVTNDDKVHCFGYNANGLLGMGHKNPVKELTLNRNLSHKQIIDFKNSLYHVIARTSDKKFYCWGKNEWGCLGNGKSGNTVHKPKLNLYLSEKQITDICCGACHTILLTISGVVFSWGANGFGQIGIGTYGGMVSVPQQLNAFNGEKVKAISCGKRHSLALTENGRVFCWGDNKFNQLGVSYTLIKLSNKPTIIEMNEIFIEKISCGNKHNLLLSSDGDIYVFGDNNNGQLGTGAKDTQFSPQKLIHSEKFTDISTNFCENISISVSDKNVFYIWGNISGKPKDYKEILKPEQTECNSFKEIFANNIQITNNAIYFGKPAEKNFTKKTFQLETGIKSIQLLDSKPTSSRKNTKSIFTETLNKKPKTVDQLSPTLNDNFKKNIKIIYVFGHNVSEVLIVTKDDKVLAFGGNVSGVLGFGHNRQVREPKIVKQLSGKKVVQFFSGLYHVMALTNDGKVYCWGQNKWGQIGNNERNNYFNKPEINKYLINEVIVDISCGSQHSLVLTKCREVYGWGHNDCGQTGNGREELCQIKPIKLNKFNSQKVVAIACGSQHSLALTETGRVYSWGHSIYGQLGIEENGNANIYRTVELKKNRPQLVCIGSDNKNYVSIKKISCGPFHSVLLSTDGHIYTFGYNRFGQIGNDSTINQRTPRKLNSVDKFKSIESHFCYDVSIAISVDNTYYIWGKFGEQVIKTPKLSEFMSTHNIFLNYFQITQKSIEISSAFEKYINSVSVNTESSETISNTINNVFCDFSLLFSPKVIGNYRNRFPVKINFEQNLKFSFHYFDRNCEFPYNLCGRNAFFVTENDNCYSFGGNNNRLLGFNNNNFINEPKIITELSHKGVINFANGLLHMIAITVDNKLYIWGNNKWGQLGNGTEDNCFLPQIVEKLSDKKFVDICCGDRSSLVLTDIGEVYSWGDNQFGQIGNESDNSCQFTPIKIETFNDKNITSISCGAYHCLALSVSYRVYSWGRNNCGQLGFERIIGSNVPKRIKIKDTNKTKLLFKRISCGYNYSLLLTTEGDLYGFGSNVLGQLGNDILENHFIPTKIEIQNKFTEVAAHQECSISVALSIDGIYYIWGLCGKQIITKPKETYFDSFDNIFLYYKKISYTQSQSHIKLYDNSFLENAENNEYSKNFIELSFISFGNFGIVTKVRHKNENEIYAIKRIGLNHENKDQVLKEYKILSKLKTDFVVKFKTAWFESNYLLSEGFEKYRNHCKISSSDHKIFKPKNDLLLHIQMEYCFKTLNEILEQINSELNQKPSQAMTPIGYYISSELLIEIIESVDHLHKQNPPIIHRDLKPTNILITYGIEGRFAKLGDFGLAKYHDFDGQSHSFVGSPNYMAPEVFSKHYDTKADIFSLGVIIPELFSFTANKLIKSDNELLNEKYNKLFDLTKQMIDRQESRPTCDEILNERNAWALSINDIEEYIDLTEIFNKSFSTEDNFHSVFIKKKLDILEQTK